MKIKKIYYIFAKFNLFRMPKIIHPKEEQNSFEQDYGNIVKDQNNVQPNSLNINFANQQWRVQDDYFEIFSLYPNLPSGISSTDTTIISE